jgi:diacylglycerol O-acyltransferase / wax synthase
MDRLSALDTSFLHLESPTTPMHISSLAIYEGPTPSVEEMRDMLASRLHLVPRFRQRIAEVPFNQHRPVWIDDTNFDLDAHLHHVALPAPGSEQQLRDVVEQLLATPIDRCRPLWEMWLVDNVSGRRFALLSKVHHALWDGVTGADLHAVLLDASPEPEVVKTENWMPRPEPTKAQLLADGVRKRMTEPLMTLRGARTAMRDPAAALERTRELATGALASMSTAAQPAPKSPLNVQIGSRRRYELVRAQLADFRAIATMFGTTINDVVLAVVAGALRRWLEARGAQPYDLRAMVPVSVRKRSQRGIPGNKLSMFLVPLPVALADPVRRLMDVHATMARQKRSKQTQATDMVTEFGSFAPPQLVAGLTRLQSVGRMFNLVASNIPGPQFPLYLLGRRLVDLFPQAPLAANQALSIAVMSYDGTMGFGLLADRDALPDVDVIAQGIDRSIRELMARTEIQELEPDPVPVGIGVSVSLDDADAVSLT